MSFIPGLVTLLLFQGLGELASRWLNSGLPWFSVPGPVLGMLGLLMFLLVSKRLSPSLESTANGFTQHLGLLFVPAAVGVVLFLPQLQAHCFAIAAALIVSVAASIAVTALVARWLSKPP